MGVTSAHPMFVAGAGWVLAGDLVPGDFIRASDLAAMRVLSVEMDATPQLAYNMEVAGAHTYFAGELEAWGHNAGRPGSGVWKVTKENVIERETCNGVLRCFYCGQPLTREQGFPNSINLDHINPYSALYGSVSAAALNGLTNICAAYRTCNLQKGAKPFSSFVKLQYTDEVL